MKNSDTLLKATFNTLTARFGEKIITSATKIAVKAQEAPENLKKEWEILKEEIYKEAERLENDPQENEYSDFDTPTNPQSPIEKIDLLRAKVSNLSKKIETLSQ